MEVQKCRLASSLKEEEKKGRKDEKKSLFQRGYERKELTHGWRLEF